MSSDPLAIWNSYVADLTGIDAMEDIAGPYEALMEHLDTNQFKGKLKEDANLWLPQIYKRSASQSDEDHTMSTDRMIEEELAL